MNKVALTLDSGHVLMRDVAVGLAEAGFDMVLHARRRQAGLRETVRRIQGLGRRAVLATSEDEASPGDSTGLDPDRLAGRDMHRLVATVQAEYGRLDVLVTRGGSVAVEEATVVGPRLPGRGDAARVPAARSREVRHAVETALRIPYHAICEALPLLSASRGAVVNVVDRDGGAESGEGLVYLTRLMAGGMAPGVRVNAVTVGSTDPLDRGADGAGLRGPGLSRRDGGAWSRELTRTVLFLLGQPYINGEVIRAGRNGAARD